jgi:GntR family transcriptional regulator, arabinose operon transcriptional repressor
MIAKSVKRAANTLRDGMAADTPREAPKFKIILDALRESIISGEYREGARLPSEAELVRRFGVSRMTIVKAFKDLQQQGLVIRRPGSGTFVAPSGLESRLFGLLIPELGQTEIFEPICQGMTQYQSGSKASLLWGNSFVKSDQNEEATRELCHEFIRQRVSGVFFAPLELVPAKDEVNRMVLAALKKAQIPVVLLDRCVDSYPARAEYDLVGIENRRAGYGATIHLVRLGATRIAFLGKRLSASTVDARIAGYREALIASNLPRREDLVTRGDPADESLVRTLLGKQRPDAILCANDLTAATLMRTLIGLGVNIPDEIRIVGIDDVKYASLLPIPLTTQHQPCQDIGKVAMATMFERLKNPDLPIREISLNCRLVIRKSCGSPGAVMPVSLAASPIPRNP